MTYFPVPFFLSTRGYGAHLATRGPHRGALRGAEGQDACAPRAERRPGRIATVYVSDDPLKTLASYTEDTGARRRLRRGVLACVGAWA